jgi:hypothetical protein
MKPMPNTMQEIHADSLWVAALPFRFFGLEMGARMTIVRLGDSSLLVICPIDLTPPLRAELDALGKVRAVVAPNRFHYLCVAEYSQAFPDAALFLAPGLKLKDVSVRGTVGEHAEPLWSDVLDQTFFLGNKLEQEVVFYHRASRTLILTDLCFNLNRSPNPWQRVMSRMFGTHKGFGPSFLSRVTTRDRKAARTSLKRVLQWDFDRIIVAHGEILHSGGKAALQKAFHWL